MTDYPPNQRRAPGPIVVGVSGSDSALAAIAVGARMAAEQHVSLNLVRVWREVDEFLSLPQSEVSKLGEDRLTQQAVLDYAVTVARAASPETQIDADLIPGDLYAVLSLRGRRASCVVVGESTDSSSTAEFHTWAREHVPCPVVIVNPTELAAAASERTDEHVGSPDQS
jgi:hypothetical protein